MNIDDLIRRIEKLESDIAELRGELKNGRTAEARVEYMTATALEREIGERLILEKMRQRGMLSDPLPAEANLSEAWTTLTVEEKRAHVELMHSLKLDPPLSEIIAQNRR
jgi:hypothetical protein